MASSAPPIMNPWEVHALNHGFPEHAMASGAAAHSRSLSAGSAQWQDPIIYPGLYSATGFDVMNVLLQVVSRPNPKIELGPVDCSVALVVCDFHLPDQPIVYASDSFCHLTGYDMSEVLGRNCRFLQTPHSGRGKNPKSGRKAVKGSDKVAIHHIRRAVQGQEEIQLQLTNYKKNGKAFTNTLSIVPVGLEPSGYRYAIGFQVELD